MEFAKPLIVLSLIALQFGCVSVNLGPKGPDKSKNVELVVPAKPYEALSDSHGDGAWQNKKNGNSISYLSTCNDPADPPLENVAREMLSDLRDPKTLSQGTSTYNGREAIDQEVEGKVDGILTRIRAVIFKKNGCTYTLTYIGVPRAFDSDRKVFDTFLKGFQAP